MSSKLIQKAYRTRKGALGTKRNKGKGAGAKGSGANARIGRCRYAVDVGQWKGKADQLFGMRVTYGLNPSQRLRVWNKRRISGYKVTMRGGCALNNFRFQTGTTHRHWGNVTMCRSGFHFSLDPLQALSYAIAAYKKSDNRWFVNDDLELYRVHSVGNDATVGHDKVVTRELCVGEEIKGKEKDRLLTGIAISDNHVECFRNGQYSDPASGVPVHF